MIVGVPRELKEDEHRVAITPVGVRELVRRGHRALIETEAGEGSTIHDGEYSEQGAEILPGPDEVYGEAELVLKVKEPQPEEVPKLREGQLLFTYLHLAAHPDLTRALMDGRVVAIAYETVQLPDGSLPLLAPMSEIAGRMATQLGAHFLQSAQGGRGVLLSGVSGVRPAKVVVLGTGTAGSNAAVIAMGMQAEVLALDRDVQKLRQLDSMYLGRILTLASNELTIEQQVTDADVVIGSVLIPGAAAPKLVSEDMVRSMKRGAVLVDVAIDQGGCFATSRETTHSEPVFVLHDVLHYAVGNIPGAVPHTSTYALTNATLAYAVSLADHGLRRAVRTHPELVPGLNVVGGRMVHPAVAESLGLPPADPAEALAEIE